MTLYDDQRLYLLETLPPLIKKASLHNEKVLKSILNDWLQLLPIFQKISAKSSSAPETPDGLDELLNSAVRVFFYGLQKERERVLAKEDLETADKIQKVFDYLFQFGLSNTIHIRYDLQQVQLVAFLERCEAPDVKSLLQTYGLTADVQALSGLVERMGQALEAAKKPKAAQREFSESLKKARQEFDRSLRRYAQFLELYLEDKVAQEKEWKERLLTPLKEAKRTAASLRARRSVPRSSESTTAETPAS